MKKLSFLFLILIITSVFSIVTGQSRSYNNTKYYKKSLPKYVFGIKAGLNYASQTCTNKDVSYNVERILGPNAGVYFNYSFVNNLSVQPELMVSVKGSHWSDTYEDMKDVLIYVELPVLICYRPARSLNIQAGPQAGYLIGANQKDFEMGTVANIGHYYNNFDFGFTFGIETNLPYNINLTLRYFMGLITITSDYKYVDRWKNNYLQLSVGYRLLSGK